MLDNFLTDVEESFGNGAFYKNILKIWTKYVSNKLGLMIMEIKWTLLSRIRKMQLKYLGCLMGNTS